MTFPIVIALDGPPRGQSRPRFRVIHAKSGGSFASAYTDSTTRNYEDALKWQAKRVMGSEPPLDCPLSVEIVAYTPIPQSWSNRKKLAAHAGEIVPVSKPDLDNIVKGALDSLNKIVWCDDSRVVALSVWKFYSTAPRLTIKVEPWGAKCRTTTGHSQDLNEATTELF